MGFISRSLGFRTGSTPQVGAIMVEYGPTAYGHVAVVSMVNGSQIQFGKPTIMVIKQSVITVVGLHQVALLTSIQINGSIKIVLGRFFCNEI
jgi:hypothetical protein